MSTERRQPTPSFPWTDESIALLRAMWADGATTLAIARRLEATYRVPVTKNMIVSKVRRLGMERRPSPIIRFVGLGAKAVERARKVSVLKQDTRHERPKATLPPLPSTKPVFTAPARQQMALVLPVQPRLQCQWLDGETPRDFVQCCNRAVTDGVRPPFVYCEAHRKRAYVPSQPIKPEALAV